MHFKISTFFQRREKLIHQAICCWVIQACPLPCGPITNLPVKPVKVEKNKRLMMKGKERRGRDQLHLLTGKLFMCCCMKVDCFPDRPWRSKTLLHLILVMYPERKCYSLSNWFKTCLKWFLIHINPQDVRCPNYPIQTDMNVYRQHRRPLLWCCIPVHCVPVSFH